MRYDQLNEIIAQTKPSAIAEIGTWNGVRAMQMAEEALKHKEKVHYVGFDLFEDATAETDERELNVKPHCSFDEVTAVLAEFQKAHPGFTFELVKGNTRETLKEMTDRPDMVFIDGGHSVETIRSDFENMQGTPVIVMDDFYTPDEDGKCPDLTKFGCNAILEKLPHTVLQNKDRVKGGGFVQMAVVGTAVEIEPGKRRLNIITKNCVSDSRIKANIRYCSTLIDRWIPECEAHDKTAVICSGGPSLVEFIEDLRKLSRRKDHRIFCVKHSHKVLLEHKITPFGCLLLDPRPHTIDFIENPHPKVNYFVASMCHPVILDRLLESNAKVWGYNALVGAGEKDVVRETQGEKAFLIGGGSTSAMRGVHLLHALGFRRVKMYGFDSCYAENVGENTSGKTKKKCQLFEIGGRKFWSDNELMAQAQDFRDIFNEMFQNQVSIEVFGDGVIPHIYRLMKKRKAAFGEVFDAS